MPETLLINHLSEPHYLTSAWRRYNSTYLVFPNSGAIFSVKDFDSEKDRAEYIDKLIDSYKAIYEAQNLSFDEASMAIGLGKRGEFYTIAAFIIGGSLTIDELQVLAKKAAEHHSKAIFTGNYDRY